MARLVRFPETRWTKIHKATDRDPASLRKLVEAYSPPLLAFIQNRGFSPEDSEDLLQEVLLRILSPEFLGRADRLKGRFRSVLLGVVKKVILKHCERRRTVKRGGKDTTISLEELRSHGGGDIPVSAQETDEFNKLWKENLLRLSLRKLREECERTGKPHHRVLQLWLRGMSYSRIARELGRSETDVTNLLHTARKKLTRHCERVISEYASTRREFQDETALFLSRGLAPEGNAPA